MGCSTTPVSMQLIQKRWRGTTWKGEMRSFAAEPAKCKKCYKNIDLNRGTHRIECLRIDVHCEGRVDREEVEKHEARHREKGKRKRKRAAMVHSRR